MSYLIDTNVISELIKKKPHPKLLAWFAEIPNPALHISVLTIGEIRKGIESLSESNRKNSLRIWLEHEVPNWFQNRILTIDQAVADQWGYLQTEAKRSLPAIDSLIAATALHYDLKLVTRNTKDFNYPALQVINPWR